MNRSHHETIYKLYSNVVRIDDDGNHYDADGNVVSIDQAAVDAAAVEVGNELDFADLRLRRNALLSQTDWWAATDLTMSAEQIAYRQALRDLPANTADPANVVWPTKPN